MDTFSTPCCCVILKTWPGVTLRNKEVYELLKTDLDRLLLEVAYNE